MHAGVEERMGEAGGGNKLAAMPCPVTKGTVGSATSSKHKRGVISCPTDLLKFNELEEQENRKRRARKGGPDTRESCAMLQRGRHRSSRILRHATAR